MAETMRSRNCRSMILSGTVCVLAALAASTPVEAAPASGAPQASPVSGAPQTPAALDTARAAYDALPLDRRVAIQTGLVWTGDLAGALDGSFGKMTFDAITAFQSRHGFAPDGILTAPALDLLGRTAAQKQADIGWQMTTVEATGSRLGLPSKLLAAPTRTPEGRRWVSKDGHFAIEAFAVDGQDLPALFEARKAAAVAAARKVDYAVLRADWFVVSDSDAKSRRYGRVARTAQGLRGFLLERDSTVGPVFDRVVIAMSGTFEPAAKATEASSGAGSVPIAVAPASAPAAPATMPAGLAATGIAIDGGRVVTALAAVADCRSITVAGKPANLAARDDAAAIAVLTGANGGESTPLSLAETPIAIGEAATVVAAGAQGTTVTTGRITGRGLLAGLQRGGLGAPLFDATGRLAGLVTTAPDETRLIAGLVPQATYATAAPSAIAALAAGGVEVGSGGEKKTSGGILTLVGRRIVAIGCGK